MDLAGLYADLRPYAEYAHQVGRWYGLEPVVTSVYRSPTKQRALRDRFERCVAEGRYPSESGPCKYPANRPGDSAHNFGLAWDSWVPDEDMPLWVAIRRWVGFRVPEHDPIHAEYPGWRNVVV